MSLYNLKSGRREGEYRITKFDDDLVIESSYLLSQDECECPAGPRPTCRHRQMLPRMLADGIANTDKFYDFDTGDVLVPIESVDLDKLGKPRSGLPSRTLEELEELANERLSGLIKTVDFAHPSIGSIRRRV